MCIFEAEISMVPVRNSRWLCNSARMTVVVMVRGKIWLILYFFLCQKWHQHQSFIFKKSDVNKFLSFAWVNSAKSWQMKERSWRKWNKVFEIQKSKIDEKNQHRLPIHFGLKIQFYTLIYLNCCPYLVIFVVDIVPNNLVHVPDVFGNVLRISTPKIYSIHRDKLFSCHCSWKRMSCIH